MMVASLYALVGVIVISLIHLVWQYLQALDLKETRDRSLIHALLVFGALRMILFIFSMMAFVAGLRSLRFRPGEEEKTPG